MTLVHRSVLLEPTVAALVDPSFEARRWAQNPDIQGLVDGVYVDCTFGRGGHSRLLLSHLSSQARLIVIDKDPQAIAVAQELAAQDSRVTVVHSGFGDLAQALDELGHVRLRHSSHQHGGQLQRPKQQALAHT